MTLSKKLLWARLVIVMTLLGVVAVSYQNCGQAGFDGSTLSDSSAIQAVDTKLSQLPFPYSGTINQVIYNSCPIDSSGAVFWNFVFGAYEDATSSYPFGVGGRKPLSPAGLKVNDKFVTAFKQSYASVTDSGVRNSKFKEALTRHPLVIDTQMFVSLRSSSNPFSSSATLSGTVFESISSGSVAARGGHTDYMPNVLAPLDVPQIVAEFSGRRCEILGDSPCSSTEIFASEIKKLGDPTQRNFSGYLGVGSKSNLAADLDHTVSRLNSTLMTVGFQNGVDFPNGYGKTPIKNIGAGANSMVGRGYVIRLSHPVRGFTDLPGGAPNLFNLSQGTNLYPARALEVTGDRDLEQSGSSSNNVKWDCRSLQIIRPEDNNAHPTPGNLLCPPLKAGDLDPETASQLNALRRALPNSEEWSIINPIFSCAVPSSNFAASCYRGIGSAAPDYRLQSWNCDRGTGPGLTRQVCAHWLTLCLRR